jgi:hypothetical protein
MSKSEPNWSPWGQKKQMVELLKSFGRQCRLHMEAELQNIIAVEREKVGQYWTRHYSDNLHPHKMSCQHKAVADNTLNCKTRSPMP